MQQRSLGPLFITSNDELLVALARAAAAAGVIEEVSRVPREALDQWSGAAAVVVGADQVAELARFALPRRSQVYVAVLGGADGGVFREALACGADAVLELPAAEGQLVGLLTDTADGCDESGVVVGVIGGVGGAGATTVAAAVASVLARSGDALLLDADPHGGGADRVVGIDSEGGVRWDALSQVAGRMSARSLRDALPGRDGLSVLTWSSERSDLSLEIVRPALSAGVRGFPVVVIDVPRGFGPVASEILARCDHVLLVSTLTVPALTACVHAARRLPAECTRVVLRGRGGVSDAEVERLLRLEVIHRMPDQRGLDEAISLGLGPLRSRRGALVRAARRIVDELGLDAPGRPRS